LNSNKLYIKNNYLEIEILSIKKPVLKLSIKKQLQQIYKASLEILERKGMKFL